MKDSPILGVFLWFATAVATVAQDARLSNLSIRANGGGGEAVVTGFTIGPGPNKTVLIRAVGPTLGAFGVGGTLADPKLVLYNSAGAKVAENDDFIASDAATFGAVGAFQLTPGGKDAALAATLAPGGYTAEVSGAGAVKGVALVEVYEVGGGATRLVNLSTRAQVGTGDGILIPGITISAGSSSRRLLIRAIGPTLGAFGVPGTITDPKLELYLGTTKIAENDNWETPVGTASGTGAQLASIFGQAGAFALGQGSKDAALLTNLLPGNYTLQVSGVNNATGEALVEVYDLSEPASAEVRPNSNVYFAPLRPGSNAGTSLASGFAAITFNPDGTALVSVNISNLSSAQTAAYLRLAGTNDYLLSLPLGQVANRPWVVGPVGIYSRNDIIKALNEGRLVVSLETAKYPGGEVAGTLVTSAGSRTFTAPAAPPALPPQVLNSPSDIDAARLLTQATFGPTDATIAEVKRLGVTEWIRTQMAVPTTSLLAMMREDATRFPNPPKDHLGMNVNRLFMGANQQPNWWKLVLTAPDQLRQRVALALGEIFVISADGDNSIEPLAQYHDILAAGAFGGFLPLLEQISTHPEMGWYLTFLRNQKADPVKGTSPDENYAREVQQLFTVGLVQLHPDGSLLLDAEGRPIPTYDNITITETAKVFTGWAYRNRADNFFADPSGDPGGYSPTSFLSDTNGRMQPMKCYEAYHDKTEKRVISLQQAPPRVAPPTVIPANQSGPADLRMLLETLVNHPNTGPFICRQLIQRLVTSNPSAGYVYRVAQVFANNGRGARGDLGAVVTAILTDYEARSPEVLGNAGYGKIKEPLLRVTALMRLLKTAAPNGRYVDSYWNDVRFTPSPPTSFFAGPWAALNNLAQAAFHAPSVFNFFSPYYSKPGPLADSGLVAPEMQIVDSIFSIKVPNQLASFIYKEPPVIANAPSPSPFLRNDFTELLALSPDPTALIERLNILLCGGQMTAATRQILLQEVSAVPLPQPPANFPGAPQKVLDASGGGLAAPPVAAFDPGGTFTIEAWVFPTALSAANSTDYGYIAGKRGALNGDPFALYDLVIVPGGRATFELSSGVVGSFRSVQAPDPLPRGTWTHVAATYDNATMRIYVNGTQVAQRAVGNVTPPAAVGEPFSIGESMRAAGGRGMRFSGLISQTRFWRVARTAAQIQQGMKEGVPSENTGLVANWLLDDGAGGRANDTSGNGYHLETFRNSSVRWGDTNGQSLDRVQTALHLVVVSPDSALQK